MQCADCLPADVEWFELSGKGKLVTCTTGFENDTPYILALAEFAGGVRVFGRLDKQIAENEIKVGMDVKLVPVKLPDERISYEFKKA